MGTRNVAQDVTESSAAECVIQKTVYPKSSMTGMYRTMHPKKQSHFFFFPFPCQPVRTSDTLSTKAAVSKPTGPVKVIDSRFTFRTRKMVLTRSVCTHACVAKRKHGWDTLVGVMYCGDTSLKGAPISVLASCVGFSMATSSTPYICQDIMTDVWYHRTDNCPAGYDGREMALTDNVQRHPTVRPVITCSMYAPWGASLAVFLFVCSITNCGVPPRVCTFPQLADPDFPIPMPTLPSAGL